MKTILSIFLASLITMLVIACHKEGDSGCLGCGFDTTIREFEFHINGDLKDNCSGKPAAMKTLEFNLFYEADSLAGITTTDENGHFTFTYKKVLPGTYWQSSQWSSLVRLIVKEDSTIYFLSGLKDLNNLKLTLNDSLDVDIILDYNNLHLGSSDTIKYWFGTNRLFNSTQVSTKVGPINNHEIIRNIRGKWKNITIDELGDSLLKVYWIIRRGNSSTTSNSFTAVSSKSHCIMRRDSLIISLP